MKNFKKIALSLLVVGVALAGSAFTNAKLATGDHYVQTGPNTWSRIAAPAVFDPLNCENVTLQPCYYEQAANDNTDYGSTLTSEQISTINGTIVPLKLAPSSIKGLYDGDTQ